MGPRSMSRPPETAPVVRILPLPRRVTRYVPCSGVDALGAGAAAERDRDVGALAGLVRGGRGLAHRRGSRPWRPRRRARTSVSSTPVVSAVRAAAGIVLRVAQHDGARRACARSPSPRARRPRATPSARRTRAPCSAISRASASAARSAAVLAPGVGDDGGPAPVEVGGREAREVGEVDEVALGDDRARDDALRRLDQRALVVERDQERQLAQGAARAGGRARAAATARGRHAGRSRRGRRADRCGRPTRLSVVSTICGVTLAW